MQTDLKANRYRFASLIESIALSPQFLNKRGRANFDDSAVNAGDAHEQ